MASMDINMILDASGSMQGKISDTVGGVNKFIEDQKKIPNPAYVTLTTFDHGYRQRFQAVPMSELDPLTETSYYGGHGGSTALIDAVGRAITTYENLPVKADKALFLIVTDGFENASREFKLADVRARIKALQDKGIAFVFLGADDAAWQGEQFGVSMSTTGSYVPTAGGMSLMYSNTSSNIAAMRSSNLSAAEGAACMDWSTPEEDKSPT